ncbi:MAG: hypothetical protein LBQ09_11540 [Acidobacteriaceae bacterium]|nr:hypothetical protein [Acidobacteriaceae bacterium]
MVALGLASWGIAAAVVSREARWATLGGLLGPLVVAAASWIVIERTHRQRPAELTSVMVGGFGVKLVFVGGYVAVMLGLLDVQPMPFVVSFTSYFIAFYVVEALLLQRLIKTGA